MPTNLQLAKILIETIAEGGAEGVPTGPMYAALMHVGVSFDTFQSLLRVLQNAKLIYVRNHVAYFASST